MLTTEQKLHFETFGYLVVRRLFSPGETEEITREFDDVLDEDRQGRPFAGENRQAVQPFVERRPLLTRLLEEDRLYGLHEDLLGPGFQWIGSDGNLYVGDTAWHPDREGLDVEYGYTRIKTALYLDPVATDTGCLRVIPGSHRPELHCALQPLMLQYEDGRAALFGVAGVDVPGVALESQPGDVVVFNQLLWHSSFGGRAGRRMLALSLISRPTTDEHFAYLRRTHDKMKFGYHPTRSWVESDRPRIRGMVSELLALGFKTLNI